MKQPSDNQEALSNNLLALLLETDNNKIRNRDPMSAALFAPTVAGYSFDSAADLANARDRERLSPSALKAFVRIAEAWNLNDVQARGLLGGIASSTFHAWKTEPQGKKLDQDTLTRISLVLGIYKALQIYFGKPWNDQWVVLANRGAMFAGYSPIDYMLRYGLPGMLQVRRMLDAWRSGR